jgi:hypothetical protein
MSLTTRIHSVVIVLRDPTATDLADDVIRAATAYLPASEVAVVTREYTQCERCGRLKLRTRGHARRMPRWCSTACRTAACRHRQQEVLS